MWLLDRGNWGREKSVARLVQRSTRPCKSRGRIGHRLSHRPKTEGKRACVMVKTGY